MAIESLNAINNYSATRQITRPDGKEATSDLTGAKPQGAGAVAKGVQEFAEIFEAVETAAGGLADGRTDAQAVVEALATAEVALESAVIIRNRVVEAYQELLRMPI
jgi:flagellar hook-basal body complex protein FliE